MSDVRISSAPSPERIGAYRIIRELGRGAMGVVFEALHESIGQRVAIKMLHAELARDPEQLARFIREGRAACNVKHAHVVAVHELGEQDGMPYQVLDLLEGETLADLLDRAGAMSLSELLAILLPVLSAVSATHAAGIVHRDLKPSNIMLVRDSSGTLVPKVLDFSISKLFAEQTEPMRGRSKSISGTPYYMAPEQARSAAVDARCDQYSLAVIAYEAVTGRRPFQRDGLYQRIHAIVRQRPTPPSRLVPGLHSAFDHVVSRALKRDPKRRYPHVLAFGAALLPFASNSTRLAWFDEFIPPAAGE
jgi:serine/threonine protein kinase